MRMIANSFYLYDYLTPLIDESWRLLSRGWVLDDLFMYCKNIQEHHSALEYQNILFFKISRKRIVSKWDSNRHG